MAIQSALAGGGQNPAYRPSDALLELVMAGQRANRARPGYPVKYRDLTSILPSIPPPIRGSRTSPRGRKPVITGFMSSTGVPSMASSPPRATMFRLRTIAGRSWRRYGWGGPCRAGRRCRPWAIACCRADGAPRFRSSPAAAAWKWNSTSTCEIPPALPAPRARIARYRVRCAPPRRPSHRLAPQHGPPRTNPTGCIGIIVAHPASEHSKNRSAVALKRIFTTITLSFTLFSVCSSNSQQLELLVSIGSLPSPSNS